jgi:glycosyltransferase involved in cell wall biosynthesis
MIEPSPTNILAGLRIAVVNPYLEGREKDCEKNLYPRSHLWGADALSKAGARVVYIRPDSSSVCYKLLSMLSRLAKGRLGNLEFDWLIVTSFWRYDLIYICYGSFLATQLLRALGVIRCPVVAWVYRPPRAIPFWKLRDLQTRFPFRYGLDGLLCLTKRAEQGWKVKWPRKRISFLAWGADTIMFAGSDSPGEFFFACGRTYRDYATLLAAAAQVPVPLKIIASRSLLGSQPLPPNVHLVQGPNNPSNDRGILYADIIGEYYAKAKAVLICLQPIEDDTSGLTNLLEALAMGRPVAITRTGSLDIDVEKEGVGRLVAPGDVKGWVDLLRHWQNDPQELAVMSSRALDLANKYYNHERHGRDVVRFLAGFLAKT